MKKTLSILILFLPIIQGYAQTPPNDDAAAINLGAIKLTPDQEKKMNAAFVLMDAVEKAGAYINSLSDLFANGTMPLPVGIKKGDYSLIVRKITWDDEKKKQIIHATCAFKFKDTGQKIAFEGDAVLEGKAGLGTAGRLALIALRSA